MKRVLYFVFAAIFALTINSCTCEDIGWTPDQVCAQLIGYVHFEDKTPVANATITVKVNDQTYTATTDENGFYRIEQIEAGAAAASVSYLEYPGNGKAITLKEAAVNECNFLLVKTESTMQHVDDLYKVWLPDVIQEDKSYSQIATYYMPYGTMEEDDDLDLKAYYEVEPYATNVTKADEAIEIPEYDAQGYKYTQMDVIITVVSKSKLGKKKAKKPFLVEVEELMRPISVTHNGINVEYVTDEDRRVSYFWTDEYGTSKLRFPIYVKVTDGHQEEIKDFNPSEFKSSGKTFTTVKSNYTRKWGVEVDWAVQTPSFLWQYVKLILGGDWYTTVKETYYNPFVKIPSGESVVLSGYQTYKQADYKCEWAHVYVKIYDGIKINMKDRKHTGGSN